MTEPATFDSKALELELIEASRYFLQIESTMHDLVKFYSTALLGVITASVAIVELASAPQAGSTGSGLRPVRLELLSVLWFAFATAGYLLLNYFMELRVRKIKMVDRIAGIREVFADMSQGFPKKLLENEFLFITGVKRSPPYLRRPSGEWYLALYVCTLNSAALALSIYAVWNLWPFELLSTRGAWVAIGVFMIAFMVQYWQTITFAYRYDIKRASKYGDPQYIYLAHGEVPLAFEPFNWLAVGFERILSWWLSKKGQ